ncbi:MULTISPECIES: 4-hydroxy-tetrahydrodipicolinate reductase [Roseivirga]|uniref:4-hydroxy-tetrahydrodipicolinate reductase n=1 Tax=Roseivirga spongicola TaxID=333140 RepID=A0A150XBK6_9BACT|nr:MULTISPECIES: 4-hydroxy-tetrahydrodipicolinate reductase [Roseivirga]KYG76107.1 4-hydroxy-tetrahydrodipicolinate reductase [Roseivirga spongicola]MBO6494325.1 4-hydroxy-tetrahydrodipicolinate reductase [Roseivirga sp.]MBO6659299.1 4-hydroxy-tetrahydrodipicolinate reductase [Roseivirga sp.]MBO6761333.1 4-hydroxy-tetrahydrodipicolinate reductase [Roseivirga sp.]MBO6907964.1 4-hydroxy-tetrahydrodipicolinate reductase [Roseivirga sp.]
MKILLLGYGKMGQLIDKLATAKGHEIVGKINIDNRNELDQFNSSNVDAAIEFSQPEAAVENIKWCLERQIPVAVGTTGWLDKRAEINSFCKANNGTYLFASNFSIGVNIFFKLNEYLAQMMADQDYSITTKEIHHTSKKDAPSGTSITLAEGILKHVTSKKSWVNQKTDNAEELEIISERIDPAPGTHEITYSSPVDTIEICHTAHSREGFAKGAIAVAEWLKNQKGVKTMDDFLESRF